MSSIKYLNALGGERRHAQVLTAIIFAVAILGLVSTWLAWRTPKEIVVHFPPSLSVGGTMRVNDGEPQIAPQEVYTFAYYIWQQLNRWPSDGSVDYGNQIFAMQNYVTPQCRAQLEADLAARMKDGELRLRTRAISEITGLSYAPNRVLDEGSGQSWMVFLDAQVQETFKGMPVKDIYVRYPVRVVRYDVDRQRNPWQLAIDCYGQYQPARLSEADLHVSNPLTHQPEVRAPALPSQIAPADLPRTVPLDAAAAQPASATASSDAAPDVPASVPAASQ
jgi:integrating conjugative element protein (TIGR03746 family)